MYWLLVLLLSISSQSATGQTVGYESYQLPLTAWIVVGVIVFGVVIILIFTWIVFFYSICKNSMEYRKFVKSLKMNRRRRRNQASAQGQQREPPVAISYRRDLRSPAQVYVSLAQLTTLAQAQHVQSRNINQERRSERDTDIDPYHFRQDSSTPTPTPSAPPLPDSPPDYYEFMTTQDHEILPMPQDHQDQGAVEQQSEFSNQLQNDEFEVD